MVSQLGDPDPVKQGLGEADQKIDENGLKIVEILQKSPKTA